MNPTHDSARDAQSSYLPGPRASLRGLPNVIRFSRDVIGTAEALFKRFGPLAAIAGGDLRDHAPLARWVLTQGADLRHELISQPDIYHKPPINKQLSPKGDKLSERQQALKRWGSGLVGLNGVPHKVQRRLLMPAFHKSRIDDYRDDIIAITDEEFRAFQPGATRDIHRDMMRLTLRIAARCLLGASSTDSTEMRIGDLFEATLKLILRPTVFLLPVDVPGMPYHRFLNLIEESDRKVRSVIAAKRARGAADGDLLSTLIRATDEQGASLSEEDLIGHISVIFFAGHEASSNALTWTLFLLSQHPRVAADLLDELSSALHGSAPTVEQLGKLSFLDAVVKESMRIMPPAPMQARIVACDTSLAGYALPAGTNVIMSIYHTHRAPEVFAHPRVFDPYRWQSCEPDPYQYAPFGTGPRTCIGASFAMLQIKLVLAMLVQRFRLELAPGATVDRAVTVTMSVKGGLPMLVRIADRQFERGVGGVRGNVVEMVDFPNP